MDVKVRDVTVGPHQPLTIIAGPCQAESLELCMEVALHMKAVCRALGFQYIFKASYDKANRTAPHSPRGPGLRDGLRILRHVRDAAEVPVTTDVHSAEEAIAVLGSVDMIQIPALLSRQTDILQAAGRTGTPVNIKKGQFMASNDVDWGVEKVGHRKVLLTERGTTFGYHNLVVDMRSLVYMSELDQPVIFDASHSAQRPSLDGDRSGGSWTDAIFLAYSAVGSGCLSGLFFETHPHPNMAASDGATSIPLNGVGHFLDRVKKLHDVHL